MYHWYACAVVCYAFLSDVPSDEDPAAVGSAFSRSRWFERGWTLQELIAPFEVEFVSSDWEKIGTKHLLAGSLERITGVSREALLHERPLEEFSVAQRFSWAQSRVTTRVEDKAYSLLGIFDIAMPTLYGEGPRAFRRLQEEIMRRIPDQSLFAWGGLFDGPDLHSELIASPSGHGLHFFPTAYSWVKESPRSLLAPSLAVSVARDKTIRRISHDEVISRLRIGHLPPAEYVFTPHGIRTQLPMVPLSACIPYAQYSGNPEAEGRRWCFAILGCEYMARPGQLLGRVCYMSSAPSSVQYVFSGVVDIEPPPEHGSSEPDLFPLSPAIIMRCRSHIEVKTVYIPHPERETRMLDAILQRRHRTLSLMLPSKYYDTLVSQGYSVRLQEPTRPQPHLHWLILAHPDHTIAIEFDHSLLMRHLSTNNLLPGYCMPQSRMEARATVLPAYSDPIERVGAGRARDPAWDVSWTLHAAAPSDRGLVWQWQPSLPDRSITLATPRGKPVTVVLGLDLMWTSRYAIRIEVLRESGDAC